MKKLLLLLFSLMLSFNSYGEKVLYCQDELSQGIAKVNGLWQKANFGLTRHTIKFSDDYSTVKGVIEKYERQILNCDFAMMGDTSLVCNDNQFNSGRSFRYNIETKKYILITSQPFGYLEDGDDHDYISAGTCQDF